MIIYSVVWPKSFHFVSYQNQNDKNSDFFSFSFFSLFDILEKLWMKMASDPTDMKAQSK